MGVSTMAMIYAVNEIQYTIIAMEKHMMQVQRGTALKIQLIEFGCMKVRMQLCLRVKNTQTSAENFGSGM